MSNGELIINAADLFIWTVIGGAVAIVFVIFLWSICSIAKISDNRSEKYWESQSKEHEDNTEQKLIKTPTAAGDT